MFRNLLAASLATAFAGIVFFEGMGAATAQDAFPNKTIRIVVSYPAGSATDVAARLIANGLNQRTGSNVIIENRPGGSGDVGNSHVARSKADGYTLLYSSASIVIQEALKKHPSFSTTKDLTTVALAASLPQFIVTNSSLGVKDLRSFVEKMKSEPGNHYYSSSGLGGIQHALLAAFTKIAGLEMKHVPFAGGEPSRLDLMAGRSSLTSLSPDKMVDDRVTILAVVSAERHPDFPNVPTIAEAGFPEVMDISSWLTWYAVMAPAGTPVDVIKTLNEHINDVLTDPELAKKFKDLGQQTMSGSTPESAHEFVTKDAASWKSAAKFVGIELE